MRTKDTRILQNGALAGYVYYSKEKKWKWRIIGRNEKKGGGETEIIKELQKKGKHDDWEKCGSLFGYIINEKQRLFEYKNINGNPQKFSRISKLYEEKEGTIVIPVFEFVKAYEPIKYTSVNNNSVGPNNNSAGPNTRPLYSRPLYTRHLY
jgi:hypothetical protein